MEVLCKMESTRENFAEIHGWEHMGLCEKGCSKPSTNVKGVATPKDMSAWSKNKINEFNWNSKGLHAIFITISSIKHVSMFGIAKEAWDILETTNEGIKTVNNSKLSYY